MGQLELLGFSVANLTQNFDSHVIFCMLLEEQPSLPFSIKVVFCQLYSLECISGQECGGAGTHRLLEE
jgi:hypothetical protein